MSAQSLPINGTGARPTSDGVEASARIGARGAGASGCKTVSAAATRSQAGGQLSLAAQAPATLAAGGDCVADRLAESRETHLRRVVGRKAPVNAAQRRRRHGARPGARDAERARVGAATELGAF